MRIMLDPLRRRQAPTFGSGLLILAGFGADRLLRVSGLSDALMVTAALLAGSDIALRAARAARYRQISIELLVTVAAGGALVIGDYWEAAVVTFLFLFGAYLEARTLGRTRRALQELLELAPLAATVLRDGRPVEVGAHEVRPGETVLVKSGARIPVDGQVLDGRAAVDESAITGESLPVEKAQGSDVFAGTLAQDGMLQVRAINVGADTTLARIIRRVEQAQEAKAPVQRVIERFARWYTPAIIGLSVVAGLVTRDAELALTLLVIGCPGALVISTPVAVVAGIGRAARRGILIKGGEYLEQAGRISAVAFDKTGTLTQGRPRLTDVVALQPTVAHARGSRWCNASDAQSAALLGWADDQQGVLRWAAIAEVGTEHPLARPIVAEAGRLGRLPIPDEVRVWPGRGVSGRHAGHTVSVGTPELMAEAGIGVAARPAGHLERLKADGKTGVLVALDGSVIGVLGIADTLRPNAPEMVARLRTAGVGRVLMLTGDDPSTARAIAAEAGVTEVYAGLLPEDKLEVIRRLQREGHVVAMAGDGINDAPALATADIGIAMGAAGTDIAIETADIALMGDDLLKIPEAVALSRATLRNIRQNVVIALATVAGLLTGVLLGDVHMAGGMLVHQASVLLVTANGMRLLGTGRRAYG